MDNEVNRDSIPLVGLILLAAGASSRMGTSKQLLPVNGQPMILRALDQARTSKCRPVVTVIGANSENIINVLNEANSAYVINHNWQSGMGTSIATGAEYLRAGVTGTDECLAGIVVFACDQPLVTADHINELVDTFLKQPDNVVASGYAGSVGIPVVFPQRLFSDLCLCNGDTGAKQIVDANKDKIVVVLIPEAEQDIDTPDEYEVVVGLNT